MKYNFIKYLSFLGIVAFAGISYAEDGYSSKDNQQSTQCCPSKCEPCCPSMYEPKMNGYNEADKIELKCDWNTYVNASFIYWEAKEKGLELGITIQDTSSATLVTKDINTMNINYKYKPGFKVGLGSRTCYDNWDIYLEYTRFYHTLTTNKATAQPTTATDLFYDTPWFGTGFLIGSALGNNPFFFSLNNKMKLSMDILDLEFARAYWVGQKLTFRTHFGLKGGWIDQKYNLNALAVQNIAGVPQSDIFSLFTNNKSDSWLIGPRVGVDTKWLVGCGFSFYGNIAASVFYQDFKVRGVKEMPVQAVSPTLYGQHFRNKQSLMNPNLELALGLDWAKYFCNDAYRFNLALGYETQFFWHQNMIRDLNGAYNAGIVIFDADAGCLNLHGLTLSARLDF